MQQRQRIAAPRLLCLALVAFGPQDAEASRIRRNTSSGAPMSEMEIVSVPMRAYRKDCWKRRPRHYALLEELANNSLPGAGMDQDGPFEEVLKDGYYPVDCLKDYMYEFGDKYGTNKFQYNQDKISGVSIVHYDDAVPREDRKKITPDVCFQFCRTVPEMIFFGIKNGHDCYCSPYYKPMAGDSGICDASCEGDHTLLCGSATKSSIFEMHLCAKTGKELADAGENLAEAKGELEEMIGKVMETANGMHYAAANLQAMFSERDWVASDLLTSAKVHAGKLMHAAEAATKLKGEMEALGQEVTTMRSESLFKSGKEIDKAEQLTRRVEESTTSATLSAQNLESLLADAAPGVSYNESLAGAQYKSVMYFVDPALQAMPSTCGGTAVGTPKVGPFDSCAEACDFFVGDCVGFSFFSNNTESGVCILFSKLTSVTYYTGCKGGPPAGGLLQAAGARHERGFDGDPFETQCVAKFADFAGTTLKPDPSGKCKNCLKTADEARKCWTEYGKDSPATPATPAAAPAAA